MSPTARFTADSAADSVVVVDEGCDSTTLEGVPWKGSARPPSSPSACI
jgi:hypothetical protein